MHPLTSQEHLLVLLGAVSALAKTLSFEPAARLELDLVVREIGSNALRYGGGGTATVRAIAPEASSDGGDGVMGIEVTIADQGPGIGHLEAAMVDGYSTGKSLGLGLGAAQRLSDELHIDTRPGAGTHVRLVKWPRRAK